MIFLHGVPVDPALAFGRGRQYFSRWPLAVYALTAASWVVLGDHVVDSLVEAPQAATALKVVKNGLLVVVTLMAAVVVLRRAAYRVHEAERLQDR